MDQELENLVHENIPEEYGATPNQREADEAFNNLMRMDVWRSPGNFPELRPGTTVRRRLRRALIRRQGRRPY